MVSSTRNICNTPQNETKTRSTRQGPLSARSNNITPRCSHLQSRTENNQLLISTLVRKKTFLFRKHAGNKSSQGTNKGSCPQVLTAHLGHPKMRALHVPEHFPSPPGLCPQLPTRVPRILDKLRVFAIRNHVLVGFERRDRVSARPVLVVPSVAAVTPYCAIEGITSSPQWVWVCRGA